MSRTRQAEVAGSFVMFWEAMERSLWICTMVDDPVRSNYPLWASLPAGCLPCSHLQAKEPIWHHQIGRGWMACADWAESCWVMFSHACMRMSSLVPLDFQLLQPVLKPGHSGWGLRVKLCCQDSLACSHSGRLTAMWRWASQWRRMCGSQRLRFLTCHLQHKHFKFHSSLWKGFGRRRWKLSFI